MPPTHALEHVPVAGVLLSVMPQTTLPEVRCPNMSLLASLAFACTDGHGLPAPEQRLAEEGSPTFGPGSDRASPAAPDIGFHAPPASEAPAATCNAAGPLIKTENKTRKEDRYQTHEAL